ncbi:MAG: YkgJ family cysteine cluster protein [Deltaproteobacteria bacterium]|nr:YkgJ family cysteine cluster protein [Deltaproteobacteria bacterium]
MFKKVSTDSKINKKKEPDSKKQSWHLSCSHWDSVGNHLLKIRWIRRIWHVWQRTPPFLRVVFSREGLLSSKGRILIRGKFRRAFLSLFPSVALKLQKHYGLSGSCGHCSTSCKLLFQCPHWDDNSSRCSVYEDRPNICRTFPITPQDIKDRNLVSPETQCGFTFTKKS